MCFDEEENAWEWSPFVGESRPAKSGGSPTHDTGGKDWGGWKVSCRWNANCAALYYRAACFAPALKYHPTKDISMDCAHVVLFSVLAFAAPAWGQSPPLLFDFSRVQHKPSEVTISANQKVPAGTVELVDGQFGKACKFSFVASTGPQFFTAWVNPTENWDQYEGFSFYVRGDGSTSDGGLEFIDGNDYALRFGYCFPIESTEWVKVSVPWRDLVPELAAPAVDAKRGFAPSRFRNVWIGKWHYWREYPARTRGRSR